MATGAGAASQLSPTPAHLTAASPGGGAGLAARAGAGPDASSPGPARQVAPRLRSGPARAPPSARVGGRGSPGAARLRHRLTHRRKVALRPSPTSYFLPGARCRLGAGWGGPGPRRESGRRPGRRADCPGPGEEPAPPSSRCPARWWHKLSGLSLDSPGESRTGPGGGAAAADRYVACGSEICA